MPSSAAYQLSQQLPIAVFDFDGTIADSLELVIDRYNDLAPRYRIKPIDRATLPRLRTLSPQAALKEHRVSFWKLPFLMRSMRKALHEHVDALKPFGGMVEAVRALSAAGCRCSILSTNSSDNIARFLAKHDLRVFEHVAGGSSMFGKASALKRLIKRADLRAERVFYVGDEVRDMTAAKSAGIRSIAVSWGYADRGALLAQQPTHLVDAPAQLIELLRPR